MTARQGSLPCDPQTLPSLSPPQPPPTILVEIESCVNSRPLTYVGSESNDAEIMMPSHFLIGKSNFSKVEVNLDECKVTQSELSDAD